MTSAARRAAAAVLAVLALVLTTAGVSVAQPRSDGSDAPRFLELRIDSVTPTTVSTSSEPVVTVTGTLENVGDRDVEDIAVRLQRAPAVGSAEELRTALTWDQTAYDRTGPFESVADVLERGEQRQFRLELALRSAQDPSLGIDAPGVYPLLVNVNGAPEYGGQARLDDARFLLPVLGVPPSENRTDRPVPPDTSAPVGITMMWPLADRPRLAAGVPGSATEPVRLVDDDLATSLADGGRLDGLLDAAERAATAEDRRVADALCLAVDPDLLVTVANMTRGYLVVEDPAEPMGDARDGEGTAAAAAWLERLRAVAGSMCTVAVPFAQVDTAALAELDDASLAGPALAAPTGIVNTILGITTTRDDVVWPDAGVLTEKAGALLAAESPVTALLADTAVDAADAAAGTGPAPVRGVDGLSTVLFDSAAATALAALGDAPQTPSFTDEDARYDLTEDSPDARLQDALGALSWSALRTRDDVTRTVSTGAPAAPDSVLFAPPQSWSASGDDAAAVLSMVGTLIRSGLATARPFDTLFTPVPGDTPTVALSYPEQAIVDGASAEVMDTAREQAPRLDAFEEALVEDPQAQLTPQQFTAPLREDLLRAMSLAGRRGPDPGAAARDAVRRGDEVRDAVDGMFAGVTVLSPGGVYTLTSEQSPLLLVARNDLPVGITVRLHVDAPSAMKITDIGPTQLPPRGSRTLTVPAQISDSRKIGVEFALTTESGLPLGTPTNVTVRSNAYGQVLAIVTGCAGALLLFLAGRRLLHRFRGEPDPADEGYEKQ
ncbi:glycoprotein [Rhodococcus sp. SJ]|uniref:glycoprotein n=1 Tax=Rhodococcus sp. SJ TaxID=3434112 RepID=UPI003D78B96D